MEFLTGVVMKSFVFWGITQYITMKVNRRFGWTFLLNFQGRPWNWRQHIPHKYRIDLNRIYGVLFQKTELCVQVACFYPIGVKFVVLIIKWAAPSIFNISKLPFILSPNFSINYVCEVHTDFETDTVGSFQISCYLSYAVNLVTNSIERGPSLG